MNNRDLQDLRLGLSLLLEQDFLQARDVLVPVCERAPESPDAFQLAALAARGLGMFDEALAEIERAVALAPELPDLHANHGAILSDLRRFEDAERALLESLRLEPNNPEALGDLGRVLVGSKNFPDALQCLETACAVAPNDAGLLSDFGVALAAMRQPERAIEAYERALAIDPENAQTHANYSRALLLAGQYETGWIESEWRFQTKQYAGSALPELPLWEGEELRGERVLVLAEQGLGDTLQMARYLPLIAQRGGRVVVQARRELHRLFEAQSYIDEVVPLEVPLPQADLVVPFLSLPRVFGTVHGNVPSNVPYLELPHTTSPSVDRRPGELLVGLIWSGKTNDTLGFEDLGPLLELEGVRFVSLQHGPEGDRAVQRGLDDARERTPDMLDTATFMTELDLVVSCDTAPCHLAAAAGVETLLLLHAGADWRWGNGGERTVWYPNVRVLRQDPGGSWEPVVRKAAQVLQEKLLQAKESGEAASFARSSPYGDVEASEPVHLAFPIRGETGWAVCGRSLAMAFGRMGNARFVADPFDPIETGDELFGAELERYRVGPDELDATAAASGITIQAVRNVGFVPFRPELAGEPRIGYTFFEKDALEPEEVAALRSHFDLVVGGSSYCAEILRAHDIACPGMVAQGIDHSVFHPLAQERSLFRDRFVVFSGGKLELRKGQDLAIRAFRILRERHDDVLLVNAWHNVHSASRATIGASPHIEANFGSGDPVTEVRRLLAQNGIDPADAVTIGARSHASMARVYRESDVGLFPNRCEGGTNLVLMEYQACGRPAIATQATGHVDVVDRSFAMPLEDLQPLSVADGESSITGWVEPSLDEIVERLELCYQNRHELPILGARAAQAMEPFTWEAAAGGLLEAARSLTGVAT